MEKGQEAENYSAKLGYWIRNTFYIMNIGERSILHHTKTKKLVCPKEELYDKLCEFHLEVGHGGMNKTYDAVHYFNFYFIFRLKINIRGYLRIW